jgi:hypothetical protein
MTWIIIKPFLVEKRKIKKLELRKSFKKPDKTAAYGGSTNIKGACHFANLRVHAGVNTSFW